MAQDQVAESKTRRQRIEQCIRRLVCRKATWLIIGGFVIFALFAVALWQAPVIVDLQQAQGETIKSAERQKLILGYRQSIVQLMLGIAVLIGLLLTWFRIRVTEKQVTVVEEGQITDRFTKAIEQLGSDKLELRLGAIFALERIAKDSQRDHWTIMEVLTTYVRQKADYWRVIEMEEDGPIPSADVQAVITVIGRRTHRETEAHNIDLSGVHLPYANLFEANLERSNMNRANLNGADMKSAIMNNTAFQKALLQMANLFQAELAGADFEEANLESAKLPKAKISGANFTAAKLRSADFREADLRDAVFDRARLSQTDFRKAQLDGTSFIGLSYFSAYMGGATMGGTHFEGTNLTGANGLSQGQIDSAILDENTKLPEGLVWKKGKEKDKE